LFFRRHPGMALLFIYSLFLLFALVSPACSAEEYTYYGVVPERIYYARPKAALPGQSEYDLSKGFIIDPSSVAHYGLLCIIAARPETTVKVYTLPDNLLVSEATLGSMEKHFVKLPNGTIFKVVSNHAVSVILLGGNIGGEELEPNSAEAPTPQTFYTATDGSCIGKEFVILGCQGTTGTPFKIIALEPSTITITREDGVKQSFKMEANSYKSLQLYPFKTYKIESTGNIVIESGGFGGRSTRSLWIPSVEGGFVGRTFYSVASSGYWPASDDGFRITALEDAKLKIWDLTLKRVIGELQIKGGTGISVRPKADAIMIESSKPVMIAYINNGTIRRELTYGTGVTYFAVKPNQECLFFLPTNSTVQAYIFAYEETLATIDDVPVTIKADSYYKIITGGFHKIIADKNLLVQVIHWPLTPPFQGIQSFGTAIPCIQTVNAAPNVKLTPLTGESLPTVYVAVGAAIIIIAALGLLFMKRGGKK